MIYKKMRRRWSDRTRLSTYRARARRGWANSDAWSFDHYLAGVIAGGVNRLRYANPNTGGPNGWPGDPMTPDEWERILEDIASGFAHYRDHEDWNAPEPQRAMTLFAEWFPHLWG